MNTLYLVLAVIGGLLLVLGLTSGVIKTRLPLSEPLVALVVGVLIGPLGLRLISAEQLGSGFLEEAARLTLAVALMGVALRLPEGYLLRHWRALAVMLGLVMPLMWLLGSALAYLLLGVPAWVALLVGGVITPTDPVVASSIVTGSFAEENLPARLRHLLSAESGANDGLALPFVMLPVLFLTHPPGEALGRWLGGVVAWEVGVAALLGLVIGYLAGRLLRWSRRRLGAERISLLSLALALTIATLGGVRLLGGDGVLAAFTVGLAFDYFAQAEITRHQGSIQDVLTRFFDLPVFVFLGLALPWQAWLELGWPVLLLAVLVLLLRRLPAVFALSRFVAPLRGWPDALFVGWFGPIGIAAVFYARLALRETGNETVWAVASLVVVVSLIAHGTSATPATRWYRRRAGCEVELEPHPAE